jgi:hypothetical protein
MKSALMMDEAVRPTLVSFHLDTRRPGPYSQAAREGIRGRQGDKEQIPAEAGIFVTEEKGE